MGVQNFRCLFKISIFRGSAERMISLEFCVCSYSAFFFTKQNFQDSLLDRDTFSSYRRSPRTHTTKLPLLNSNNALLLQVVRENGCFDRRKKKKRTLTSALFWQLIFLPPTHAPTPILVLAVWKREEEPKGVITANVGVA